jgi:SulP family sulfate permease
VLLLHLSGPFSFCSARDLVRRLGTIGDSYRAVVFDLTDVPMIDTSIAMAIEEVIRRTLENGQATFVSGVGGEAVTQLERLKILDQLPSGHRHATRHDAILAAAEALESDRTAG